MASPNVLADSVTMPVKYHVLADVKFYNLPGICWLGFKCIRVMNFVGVLSLASLSIYPVCQFSALSLDSLCFFLRPFALPHSESASPLSFICTPLSLFSLSSSSLSISHHPYLSVSIFPPFPLSSPPFTPFLPLLL
jgi:hypothetical protein